jgi:putative hydrolase of the HAD superfamily
MGRIPPGVRAVFFDAVGTLIHPDPPAADAYATAGRRHGSHLAVAEVRQRFVTAFRRQEQADRERDLRTSEERERERWRLIVAEVLDDVSDPERCFEELHAYFAQPAAWGCDPATASLLHALRSAGYTVGLASNFDHRLHGLAATLPPLAGLDHIVVSSEVGWKKPSPRFFARLMEATGLAAGAVLIVGDDLDNDVAGARAVGMKALLYDPRGAHALPGGDPLRALADLVGGG